MRYAFWLVVAFLGVGAPAPSPVVFDAPLDDNEARIAVGEDLVAYTTRPGGEWQLITRTRSQGKWGAPTVLLRAPTGTLVMGPSFSPDGRRVYFESNHRVPAIPGRDDSDVWVLERSGSGWGAPRALGPAFATIYNEHSPTVDAQGSLCVNSARPDGLGRNDIYCGHLDGTAPHLVAELSSAAQDAFPWLDRSGRFLLLASNRDGGQGGWDLYVACRTPLGWSPPRNLGAPINTAADESGPTLSPRSDRLFFTSVTTTGESRRRVVLTLPFAPPDCP